MKRLTVVKAVPTLSPARPENEVARMIRSYGDARGLDTSRNTFVPLDTDRSRRIADAYEAMRHDPYHPDVVRSMASLKGQLEEQYEHALRHGYRFTPWTHEGQPYANSNEMMDDVLGNRHLYFFKTDSGFGSSEFDASDNPLLTESPFVVGGHRLLHNDVLRAVHDLYGHAAHGHQFGPIGEDRAWHAHLQMFHPDALPSLTTETRGQNSWVNFGPHLRRPDGSLPAKGDPDFLHPSVRPFADQKTGILPAFALQSHWDAHPEWVGKGMPFRPEMTDLKRRLQAGPDVSDWLHLLPEFMEDRGIRGQGGSPEAEYQALSEGRKGAFFRWLEDHPETRYGARLSEYGAPPSNTLQYKRIDRPGWSIHFTDNAPGVARHGFLYGHPSYEGVHITTGKPDADRMAAPGYNFAFRLDGSAAKELNHHTPGNGYGVDAVVFPSGGLTAYHLSDDESQHVFHGPSVDPMHVHAIQRTGNRVGDTVEWKVVDAMGRHRFTGKLPAAVQHVVDNHEQLARAKVRAWGRIDPAFATYRAPEVWSSRGPRPGRLTKALLTAAKALDGEFHAPHGLAAGSSLQLRHDTALSTDVSSPSGFGKPEDGHHQFFFDRHPETHTHLIAYPPTGLKVAHTYDIKPGNTTPFGKDGPRKLAEMAEAGTAVKYRHADQYEAMRQLSLRQGLDRPHAYDVGRPSYHLSQWLADETTKRHAKTLGDHYPLTYREEGPHVGPDGDGRWLAHSTHEDVEGYPVTHIEGLYKPGNDAASHVWTDSSALAFRRAVQKAAEAGNPAVTWSPGDVHLGYYPEIPGAIPQNRQGQFREVWGHIDKGPDEDGLDDRMQNLGRIGQYANEYARQLHGDGPGRPRVEITRISGNDPEGKGFYPHVAFRLPISRAMRDRIMSEGLPYKPGATARLEPAAQVTRPMRVSVKKALLTVVKASGLTARQKAEEFGVNESDTYCPDCGAVYEWGDGKCNRCGSAEKPVEYRRLATVSKSAENGIDSPDFRNFMAFAEGYHGGRGSFMPAESPDALHVADLILNRRKDTPVSHVHSGYLLSDGWVAPPPRRVGGVMDPSNVEHFNEFVKEWPRRLAQFHSEFTSGRVTSPGPDAAEIERAARMPATAWFQAHQALRGGVPTEKGNPFPAVPRTEVHLPQHQRYLNSPPVPFANHDRLQPHQMTFDQFAGSPGVRWHGSAWHDFGAGENPLIHAGEGWQSAYEALSSRIAGRSARGIPEVTPHHPPVPVYASPYKGRMYESNWGPHEHNLEARELMEKEKEATGTWPKEVKTRRGERWTFVREGRESREVPGGLRPVMVPVRVVGPMGQGLRHDFVGDRRPGEVSAESMLRGQLKRGQRPKQGYYYKNEGEGVSAGPDGKMRFEATAVVPHRSWLKTHEDFVRDALAAGQEVPPHVLAEYPHLNAPSGLSKSLLTIVKAHLPSAVLRQRIAAERKRVDLSPTDAEKEAGNYSKGHIPWKGFRIAIENPKGTRRKGKGWLSPPLPCDYGQFVGEKPGNDGDAVDVLIGPHPESEVIFVVNQMKYPDMKELDEHKVLVGFRSAREAKAAYLGCYKPGWKCGPIGTITLDQFKAWMKDGDRSKPVTPATP